MTRRRIILTILGVLAVMVVTASEWLVRQVAVPSLRPCQGKTFMVLSGFHGSDIDDVRGCVRGDSFEPEVTVEGGVVRARVPEAFAERIADPDWLLFVGSQGSHAAQPTWVRVIDVLAPFSHVPATLDRVDAAGTPREYPLPVVRVDGDNSAVTIDLGGELDPETQFLVGRRLEQRA